MRDLYFVLQTPSRFHSRPAALNKPDLPKFDLKLTQVMRDAWRVMCDG